MKIPVIVVVGLALGACSSDSSNTPLDSSPPVDTLVVDAGIADVATPDGPTPDTLAPDQIAVDQTPADTSADLPPDATHDTVPHDAGCPPAPVPANGTACVTAPAGLIAWWRAENDYADSVGSFTGNNVGTTFTSGKVGQAFSFDGSSQYISLGDITDFDFTQSAFTIETWFRIADLPTLNPGGSGCNPMYPLLTNRDWGWSINITEAGAIAFGKYLNFSTGTGVSACTVPIALNTWTHVAVVVTTTELRFYLNGVLQGQKEQLDSTIYYHATDQPEFGRRKCANGTYFFKGALDEISIYGQALQASDIQAIAAAGTHGKCP